MNASEAFSPSPVIAEESAPGTFRHLAILTIFALVVCWPVLVYGLPDLGNDSIVHALMDRCFDIQFWSGDLYPRWLADMNAGLGSPNFFFQPPVPSYGSAIFWPLVANHDPYGFHAIGLSCVLAVILSGFAVYFWCRSFTSPAASLFAGLIYVILPYHLAVNVYTRGAASELWANVWTPLILLAVNRIIQGSKWGFPGLIASYALLVLNHLPTTLCFSLVPLFAALFLSEAGQRIRTAVKTAMAMAIGIGIAACYLFPSMLDQNNINMADWVGGWFDYHRWWLFGIHPLLDARTRLMLLTVATLGFAATMFWVCWQSRPVGIIRRQVLFQGGVALAAFLMTTQLTLPIWSVVRPLHFLQFPTRFLQVFVVMVAGLAALGFPYLRQPQWRPARAFAAVLVFGWMIANVWAASMAFSQWRAIPQDLAALYSNWRTYRTEFYGVTRWVPKDFNRLPGFETFVASHPPRASELVGAGTGKRLSSPEIENWQPRRVILKVNTPAPARLTLNHLYYPGWNGRVEGSDRVLPATPSQPNGFIQMDIPEGRYNLILELGKSRAERLGDTVSLVSIALTIVLTMWAAFWRKRRTDGQPRTELLLRS